MPLPVPAPQPFSMRAFLRIVDWRLVAAIGLPLWAFLFGVVVVRKSPPPVAPPSGTEVAMLPGPTSPPAPAPLSITPLVEAAPAPREIVIRTEVVTVPIAVPVPAEPAAEVIAPAEFKLPASEVVPADRCKTFDTRIRFHAGLPEATAEAKTSKKMLLVLHISGNFDDPGFT